MSRTPNSVRSKIIRLNQAGHTVKQIHEVLQIDGVAPDRTTIRRIIKRYKQTSSIGDKARSGRPSKFQTKHMDVLDAVIKADDEAHAEKVRDVIMQRTGDLFSVSTVKRMRRTNIQLANRVDRYDFAMTCIKNAEQFHDVLFTDECSVELDDHARITFRRNHEQLRLESTTKHPLKVHIWAAISTRGRGPLLIFEGIMKKEFYVDEILKKVLHPYLCLKFPNDGYRLLQDDDPKHTSTYAREYMTTNNINWWKSPAESPDINPIHLVWHQMKHFLRTVHKPHTKNELVAGIKLFWRTTLTTELCRKYIRHLRFVLPAIVEREGKATGY